MADHKLSIHLCEDYHDGHFRVVSSLEKVMDFRIRNRKKMSPFDRLRDRYQNENENRMRMNREVSDESLEGESETESESE